MNTFHKYEVGDVVSLAIDGRFIGTIVSTDADGLHVVKWKSGVTELIHASELTPGAPLDEAYELDDPKHPTWRERLSDLWDSRPGK